MSNAYYMVFETAESYERMIAEVVREAGARALEEAAQEWRRNNYNINRPGDWLRARAAEIREGKSE